MTITIEHSFTRATAHKAINGYGLPYSIMTESPCRHCERIDEPKTEGECLTCALIGNTEQAIYSVISGKGPNRNPMEYCNMEDCNKPARRNLTGYGLKFCLPHLSTARSRVKRNENLTVKEITRRPLTSHSNARYAVMRRKNER